MKVQIQTKTEANRNAIKTINQKEVENANYMQALEKSKEELKA